MPNFRDLVPLRRPKRKVCKKYSSYLKTLRADFNQRCGYCNDHDKLRIRSFTIDHFVPRTPTDFIHAIQDNHYYNLVYSCRYCNSAKTNKWPTKDAGLHNDGVKGFIDPCSESYTDTFTRLNTGKIIATDKSNALTQYLINELNLWLPIHERMWKLERIKILNEAVKEKLELMPESESKKKLQKLHYEILQFLDEVQSTIFIEND